MRQEKVEGNEERGHIGMQFDKQLKGCWRRSVCVCVCVCVRARVCIYNMNKDR